MAGRIVTNAAGDQLIEVNGQWIPVEAAGAGSPGSTAPNLHLGGIDALAGFAGGAGIGVKNILESLGLAEETAERTRQEREFGAQNPISTALGEGVISAAAAIPGAIGGEAPAGVLGMRALGTFLMSSIGSGFTAQTALDEGPSVSGVGQDVGIDAALATALGIAGRIPSMAVRVGNAIRKGGKFKREVEPGDQPGSSADLVNLIQDADIPITTAQASGNQADLLLEGSLRRNTFQIGPGFTEIDRAQQVGVNVASARAIGLPEGTEFLDAPTIAGAKQNIGEGINAFVDTLGDMPINQSMIDDFTQLAETPFIKGTTGQSGLGKIAKDLQNKLDNSSNAVITPSEWKDMRELINAELGDASGANTRVLGSALDIVDGMPNVPEAGLEAYGALREQWRTVLNLEKGATVTPDGNVNVGQLNRNLQNSFGNTTGDPSRTAATQQLRELSEAFGTRRMQKGPTSGTAENLAVANAINQTADVASAVASGDVTGGVARGAVIGGINALGSPLHLGPQTSPEIEQVLRFLGLTGAAAGQQTATGNN